MADQDQAPKTTGPSRRTLAREEKLQAELRETQRKIRRTRIPCYSEWATSDRALVRLRKAIGATIAGTWANDVVAAVDTARSMVENAVFGDDSDYRLLGKKENSNDGDEAEGEGKGGEEVEDGRGGARAEG